MSIASNIAEATLTGWTLPSSAAFVGSVATSQVMGAFWYSPILFADYWISLAYPQIKTQKDFEKEIKNKGWHPNVCYASAMTGAITGFFLLRGILRLASVDSAIDGAMVGIMLSSIDGMFGMMHPFFENRAWQLYALNHAYHAVCFAMAGAILASFA